MAIVKLVLDELELEIGSEGLSNILAVIDFDETKASDFLMRLLETSKSSSVKAEIARRSKMPAEVVHQLLREDIYEVTEALIHNKHTVPHIPRDWISALIKSKNANLIVNFFDNLKYTKLIEHEEVFDLMAHHPDPAVRKALVANSGTKVILLRQLKNDEDPEISELACASLRVD